MSLYTETWSVTFLDLVVGKFFIEELLFYALSALFFNPKNDIFYKRITENFNQLMHLEQTKISLLRIASIKYTNSFNNRIF